MPSALPFDLMHAREWTIVTAPFFTWFIAFVAVWIGRWIVTRRNPAEIRGAMARNRLWKWSFLAAIVWLFGGVALMLLGVGV